MLSILALSFAVCLLTVSVTRAEPTEFYVGASMNFASYLQDRGIVYKENNQAKDPYASIADHGGNIVRLEHVFGPYDNQYTQGYPSVDWGEWGRVKNDVATAQSYDLDVFLTLTFKPQASNYIAGSSNYIPDAWVGQSDSQLQQNIYNSTYSMLNELGQAGQLPAFVSIGNEINGLFMEDPTQPVQYDAQRMTDMMNAGFDAVRDIAALYNTDIHAAAHIFGPDNIDWWLNTAGWTGLNDFDTVALSYYPDWHSFNDFNDFNELAEWTMDNHGKNVFLLETAQPWSSGFGDNRNNVYNYNPDPGQPLTPAVQRQFLADIAEDLISGGGLGVITWGTEWVSSDGVLAYADEYGPASSWENNAYWDFNNNLHEGIDWMADIQALYGLPAIAGDLDGDGFVGINDLNIILANWNQNAPPADPLADPSGDGFVGIDDLNIVLANWNAGTPPQDTATIPEPTTLTVVVGAGALILARGKI